MRTSEFELPSLRADGTPKYVDSAMSSGPAGVLASPSRPGNNREITPLGEIRSSVEIENTVDRGVFDRCHREERAIREATSDGMVDTGAVTLVLPQIGASDGLSWRVNWPWTAPVGSIAHRQAA